MRLILYEPMSLLEENWTERTTKNALRAGASAVSHVIVGCDLYNGNLTGGACTLNANSGASPNTAGPSVLILNDQGGGAVMDISHDATATLRAQEHGHPPVACYCIEGHIVDRKTGQNGRGWREGSAHTLNATGRHAVAYPANPTDPERERVMAMTNRGYVCGNAVETIRAECHLALPIVAYKR